MAYDTLGTSAQWSILEEYAEIECGKMLLALQKIEVEHEANPCRTGWEC
ncbi:hypothetical protein AGMMS50284_4520 [Clostridia bacterium]|nr:hypothetical protein AGMMS50284_4520 [Clostridia bacterium]